MNEMKTVLAVCLKNFEFSVDATRHICPVPELILRAKGGLWLKVKPLQK